MADTITKTITVTGIETKQMEFGTKYTLQTDNGKYSFYDTKKDGNKTTAFEQFTELEVKVGTEYPVAVAEEEKSFVPKEGKNKGQTVKYMDRRIMYFITQEAEARKALSNTPKRVENAPQAQISANNDVLTRLKKLEEAVFGEEEKELPKVNTDESEIKIEDVPF